MVRARAGNLLWIFWAALACQSAPPSQRSGGTGGSQAVGGDAAQGGAANSASTATGAVGSSVVGSTSGGSGSSTQTNVGGIAGTTGVGTGGVPEPTDKVVLSKATARIGGRHGDNLYVAVEGKAAVGVLGAIEVNLLDTNGNGVVRFDNDWDGVLESSVGRLQPTKPPSTEVFAVEAVMSGARSLSGLSELHVALFDRENRRTEPLKAVVQQQPVVELGGACDTQYAANRCREGLTCTGSPPTCVAGTAPTILHAAFHRGTEGPFIRMDGADPDEDVILVRVDFLTTADSPISLDLDGDEILDADHLEVDIGIVNQNGGYTFIVESGQNFDVQVPRLGLTAIDSKGNLSATQRVNVSNRTTRIAGQSCDMAGFVGCVAGTSCMPGNGTTLTGYCTTYAQAETARCGTAATWDLTKDPAKITGFISGYSAWEPPAGCLSSTSTNRPEAVIKLHVPKDTPKLVLSTAEPETLIDTGIVVLPSCTALPAAALGCNDDSVGYTSALTLTNVAAGDYIVIVEAVQSDGGGFGLSARTE